MGERHNTGSINRPTELVVNVLRAHTYPSMGVVTAGLVAKEIVEAPSPYLSVVDAAVGFIDNQGDPDNDAFFDDLVEAVAELEG